VKDKQIILKPVKITPMQSTLEDIRDKIKVLSLNKLDIKEAIRWARKKKSAVGVPTA